MTEDDIDWDDVMSDMYLGMDAATQVQPKALKKVALAKRVGAFMATDNAPEEMSVVAGLARVLSRDIELSVRVTLAFELRQSKDIPKDIALRIAQDVEDVASPFLQETPVLDDEDLADMIPHLAEYARVAVAKRETVGVKTASCLIDFGGTGSVSQLARNPNAALDEGMMSAVYSRFNGDTEVMDALSRRVDLPIQLVEDLVGRVTDAAKDTLIARYGIQTHAAESALALTKRQVMFSKLRTASLDQVRAFVTDLRHAGRLSDALILDAAKARVPAFVEVAVALEAGLTVGEAAAVLQMGAPDKVIPLLRDAGIARDAMAQLIKDLATCYHG